MPGPPTDHKVQALSELIRLGYKGPTFEVKSVGRTIEIPSNQSRCKGGQQLS